MLHESALLAGIESSKKLPTLDTRTNYPSGQSAWVINSANPSRPQPEQRSFRFPGCVLVYFDKGRTIKQRAFAAGCFLRPFVHIPHFFFVWKASLDPKGAAVCAGRKGS